METATITTRKRSAGRPPRFTLEQVIDAACEIGLDAVDMISVAKRLGVGVATLYGYVDGRDHLVQLAAQRLASRDGIADTGQSWQDALREHASRSFAIYCATPQLIPQLMNGMLGDLADSPHTDALLSILIDRGLAPQRALAVFLETNQIVIGAAVGVAYVRSMHERAGSRSEYLESEAAKCAARNFGALARCLASGDLLHGAGDFGPALERLIASHEGEMSA